MSRYVLSILTVLCLSRDAYAEDPVKPHKKVCFNKHGPKPCPTKKAPPPKPMPPDDSNTCTPSPPTCTGQWCTSCTDGYCLDIDGPGASASLCGGTLSWCDDASCGESTTAMLEDFAVFHSTTESTCHVVHGYGGCMLTCGDVYVSCHPYAFGSATYSDCLVSDGGAQYAGRFSVGHDVCG